MRSNLLRNLWAIPLLLVSALSLIAQQAVTITVDVSKPMGPFDPVWAWVGHDEPNYTYSEEGRHLLTELSQISAYPVHDRTHNLLTTGDGTPALKWGSTNAFTRDASGKSVYDWTIIDKIFDSYKATGITPFVEIGFMPEALSSHPEPYQNHWPKDFDTGWAYPPTNYDEWSDLVYHWVQHMVARYGTDEVAKWEWEVWNEPDITYWHGTVDEYLKLYDYTVAAVERALPNARVGGPATTGPANPKAAAFLRAFLEHCANGRNYATGKSGAPLDFISFHAKGRARLVDGHVELSLGTHLRDINEGFAIIEEFPSLRHLPVVLSESDPEPCAACDVASHPQNEYRLTSQYASYEADLLNETLALAERHYSKLEGAISWAFTFPGQPIFAGLRAFTTHDVDLPLLNAYRMFGQMTGERVAVTSNGAIDVNRILQSDAGADSDVNAMATYGSHRVNVLVWNYHDNSGEARAAEVHLILKGLPEGIPKMLLKHWRVDRDHSNAYTAWQNMRSPLDPSPAQSEQLKSSGRLQLLESPIWVSLNGNALDLHFTEPVEGLSLLELTW